MASVSRVKASGATVAVDAIDAVDGFFDGPELAQLGLVGEPSWWGMRASRAAPLLQGRCLAHALLFAG